MSLLRPSKPKRLARIRGVALLGFADAFDGAYGDFKTKKPYVEIRPTRLGEVLLPFYCPWCSCAVGPTAWIECRDLHDRYNWCPACQKRFLLDRRGVPIVDSRGVKIVAVNGVTDNLDARVSEADGLNLLGADLV